jgi:hypothetical protein
VLKGVDSYDVRPVCFDTAPDPKTQFQPANCSVTGGSCTNFAGTVGTKGTPQFTYNLGDTVGIDDLAGNIKPMTVFSIEQQSNTLFNEPGQPGQKITVTDANLAKCWPGATLRDGKTPSPNAAMCTRLDAYQKAVDTVPSTSQFTYHYGMEIKQYTDTTHSTYKRGVIQSFQGCDALPPAAGKNCKTAQVQLLSITKPAAATSDVCYDLHHDRTKFEFWDLTGPSANVAPICYTPGELM